MASLSRVTSVQARSQREVNKHSRRVAQAFDLAGITNAVGRPVLLVLGEERVRAKTQGQGYPRTQLPAPFERTSDPQIFLTRLKKWSSCRFSVSATTI